MTARDDYSLITIDTPPTPLTLEGDEIFVASKPGEGPIAPTLDQIADFTQAQIEQSDKPAAADLTGPETVRIKQNGQTVQTTMAKIMAFVLAPFTNASSTDAGALTGAEVIPASRGAGLLQTTVAKIVALAQAPFSSGTAGDAGALTGAEITPLSRGNGLLQSTVLKVAQWTLQTFQGFKQNGSGTLARTFLDKARETVSITDFTGFDPTGATVSDAAFLAAIAALPSGGKIVIPPGAKINLATPLIANQPVLLWSDVRGDLSNNTNGSGTSYPIIKWTGASGNYIFTIKPAVTGYGIWGGGSVGIEWDGNSVAGAAVHLDNTKFAKFDGKVRNTTYAGVIVDSASGIPGNFSAQNEITLEYIWGTTAACQNSHGLLLGGNGGTVAATQQRVRVALGLVYNGALVKISETDNCVIDFLNCSVQSPGTGVGLDIRNVGAQPSNHTLVKHMSGPIQLDAALVGTKILQYVSEGGGIKQIAGTSLWDGELVDYVNGKVYKSHVFRLLQKLQLPASSFSGDSGTTLGKYGLLWQTIQMNDAGDSTASCITPAPYDLDAGKIVGVEFFIGSNGTTGGNYNFEIRASAVTPEASGGPGVVTPNVIQTTTVAAGAQYTQKKYTVNFTTPINYKLGDSIFVQFVRHGQNAADTNTDACFFLGARVLYTGTGPSTAGSGTYTLPPL